MTKKSFEPFYVYLTEDFNESECQEEYGVSENPASELTHFAIKVKIMFDDNDEIIILGVSG